jgi:nitrate reductase (NAD(P)H)
VMNNPWFRVTVGKEGDYLRFEHHRTQLAFMPGGWMERVKVKGGNLSNGFWVRRYAVKGKRKASSKQKPMSR